MTNARGSSIRFIVFVVGLNWLATVYAAWNVVHLGWSPILPLLAGSCAGIGSLALYLEQKRQQRRSYSAVVAVLILLVGLGWLLVDVIGFL